MKGTLACRSAIRTRQIRSVVKTRLSHRGQVLKPVKSIRYLPEFGCEFRIAEEKKDAYAVQHVQETLSRPTPTPSTSHRPSFLPHPCHIIPLTLPSWHPLWARLPPPLLPREQRSSASLASLVLPRSFHPSVRQPRCLGFVSTMYKLHPSVCIHLILLLSPHVASRKIPLLCRSSRLLRLSFRPPLCFPLLTTLVANFRRLLYPFLLHPRRWLAVNTTHNSSLHPPPTSIHPHRTLHTSRPRRTSLPSLKVPSRRAL